MSSIKQNNGYNNEYNKRNIGSSNEELASAYLVKQGVKVIEKNFRVRQGEIDIIGFDHGTLVFFEVKYRKGLKAGHPLEAVSYRKQKQICKISLFYLSFHHISMDQNIRYDVVGILDNQIEWIKNAFEYVV